MRFFYSGQGNKEDGAMCFSDGVITCEEFFKLAIKYRSEMEDNDLHITLDSSYSFHWCRKVMENNKMKITINRSRYRKKNKGNSYCNEFGGFFT